MPRPGYLIYEDEMLLKGHGFPVWFGDPYGKAEIKIGDIGYMREGMFVHVMNCNFRFSELITTPVDFNGPIYSQSFKKLEGGAEAGVSGVNSHISLASTRDKCAMLNVEEGVANYTRCSDVDKEAVEEKYLQNARKWIAKAVKERRIASKISIERLILVTGFYKCANWEAAVLSSSSSTGDLSFTIKISQVGGGISINWDSVQHLSPDYSTGHRHPTQTDSNEPPVLGPHGDITRGTNSLAGPRLSFERCCHQHADRNQCIFLRGFRIRERLGAKDQVVEQLISEGSKPSFLSILRSMNTNSKTSKSPSYESGQRSSSAYDYLEPIEEFLDTNFCDQLYDAIAVKKFMENNSDLVLVHDDELIGILERNAEALDSEPGSSSVVPHVPSISDSIEKIFGNLRNSDSGLTVLQTSRDAASKATIGRSKEKGHQVTTQQFVEQFTDPSFILSGHTHMVSSVAFSPDGRCVVSGSLDETVRIWDAETGNPLGEPFRGHTNVVTSVAFSPDGKSVVSGSADQTVRIWDVETGKPVGEPFRKHTHMIRSVAFSPDGKSVVSGSLDQTVRIWDVQTGKPVGAPFQGHTRGITSVAFSPDGKTVVSGSFDQTVRIWDAETGNPLGEPFRGHTNGITSVAFSPNGESVVSGSFDQTARIWDAETGKLVREPFQGHSDRITSVAFSPESTSVVSGSDDQTVRIWDAETGKPVGEPFRGHTGNVTAVSFSPDGRRVVSGSTDLTVRIWDAKTGKLVYVPEVKTTILDT